MTHVQRAGGIGGDEFHLHGASLSGRAAAVAFARGEDVADHPLIGRAVQKEIDEARPGDLDFRH